ncbi:MAG: LPS export ABC transporter periplasmic protein LptC [Treponema sp.]|jgi:LPS export ABC transporter protein LptC|nr:LPS export ABC transporter periplasmic protein LptC [Treponema sp.]
MKKVPSASFGWWSILGISIILGLLGSCSFDYGESTSDQGDLPDIVMKDVKYVRVRNGNPLVRFTAESAERYEKRQTMELTNFSFEQFEHQGTDINAVGQAGTASVELDSGNIQLRDGVRLEVESEDIIIETKGLDWQDKERILSGGAAEQVDMQRSDGTNFSGWGFSADVRNRTWGFASGINGTYIWEDEEEEEQEEKE